MAFLEKESLKMVYRTVKNALILLIICSVFTSYGYAARIKDLAAIKAAFVTLLSVHLTILKEQLY